MRRRQFIRFVGTLGGTVALSSVARALKSPQPRRIGVLWPGTTPPMPPRLESLRQGLRDAGMIEGPDYQLVVRYARDGLQQLPALASELIRMKVDLIQPAGDNAIRVAQDATTTIPIVATSDDMLGMGLISSLSRPGGNTTGLTILSPELNAKRLQLLKDLNPAVSRVASLWDPTTGRSQVTQTKTAATALQINLQISEIRSSKDLVTAFEEARREQAEALNVFSSPFLASIYMKIIDLAAKYRIPAIYQWKEHAEAGGLMSYGPSLAGMFRQIGEIVAKVLRGANPAEYPVEQPVKFELVINLKAAKALGLAVPHTLLARADEVIE